MKKIFAILVVLIVIIAGSAILLKPNESENQKIIRLHIRANSNSSLDQQVKFEVKEIITEYLTPIFANLKSKQECELELLKRLSYVEKIASDYLQRQGFDYLATAKFDNEYFPTRRYDSKVFDAGYYDALIINLGSGTGDNWWCVVYPPFCFLDGKYIDGKGIIYKSKIEEIIASFLNKT